MNNLKRPKAGDTEEDLLKQEKEFMESLKSQKISPAAKVVRVKKEENSGEGKVKNVENDNLPTASSEDDHVEVEHPAEAVLFQVKERAFDATKLKDFSGFKALPKVPRVHRSVTAEAEGNGPTKRKKSLFARSFDNRQELRHSAKEPPKKLAPKLEAKVGDSAIKVKVEKSQERVAIGDRIHPYLAGMTEEEILEEQRKLLERLDPRVVEFIRNRGLQNNQSSTTPVATSTSEPEPMHVDTNSSAHYVGSADFSFNHSIEEDDLPINPKNVEKYPRMSKVEYNKLAWAGVVKCDAVMDNAAVQAKGKTARFDFKGLLISEDKANDPSTYDMALHNHGDEMERPGYSIEELLILGRSTTLQQRSVALDTLGKIYSHAHSGIYDEVFEQSVFNLLDYMDFIYVIRKGLDNNDSSINSALSCLSALLYPESEEICLDVSYLWPNARPFPLLVTKPDEIKKDASSEKEMKDFEFLQLDLLDFLIGRTEIISRIEYLLTSKTELFNELGVISVLKILIRCARHSPGSVLRHEKLLKYIVVNHISPNWNLLKGRSATIQGIPLVTALKLVRVLIESNLHSAMKLYHNYSVLPSVMSYLAYDQWREQAHVLEVEDLVLESFRIWLAFLHHRIAIDEYVAFFPVLMQFLTFYGRASVLSSFDLSHSAHLFALLSQIICFGENSKSEVQKLHSHWNLVKDAKSMVEEHCNKLLKIFVSPHLQDMYNVDLALLSLGKGLEFLTYALNYCDKTSILQRFQPVLREFVKSSTYMKLTSNLVSHSVLLADSPEKSRYPVNFASVGAIRWQGELNPALQSVSPFHFLTYFVSFCKTLMKTEANELVSNTNIDKYLCKLKTHDETSDNADYFVRFEIGCLYELLDVLPKIHPAKFPVSYRLLARVPACCDRVFKKVLKVSLHTCCKDSDVDVVYQFYLAYFFLSLQNEENQEEVFENKKSTKVRFDDGGHPGDGKLEIATPLFQNWTVRLADTHWIFHPLENLYKRAVSAPRYVDDNLEVLEQETRGCLSFIKHCLIHYCDSIVQIPQDLVTVYCRICRTFMLGTPNVYFDDTTTSLLKDILLTIVNGKVASCATKSIFSKYKPSHSAAVSFYDFYTELVREYFDNSYFNEVFASYLFLPLRSPEDLKVKSCFWNNEHLRYVRLSSDKLPISTQYLTSIPEQNPDMLMIFTRHIKRGTISKDKNSFLYEVIVTHLKNSQEFMTDDLKNEFKLLSI